MDRLILALEPTKHDELEQAALRLPIRTHVEEDRANAKRADAGEPA